MFQATGRKPNLKDSNILPLSNLKRKAYEAITEEEAESWKQDIMCKAGITTNEDLSIPMLAWDSMLMPKDDQIQEAVYLLKINLSLTSYPVVTVTLHWALCIAEECGKMSIAVTYDIATAKVALQIQYEEQPTNDSICITLGVLHLKCAMPRVFAMCIAESGRSHVLNEWIFLAKE